MTEYLRILTDYYAELGLGDQAGLAATATLLIAALVLAFLVKTLAQQVLLRLLRRLASRTKTELDDLLVRRRFFARLAHLAPAFVLYTLVPFVFASDGEALALAQRILIAYMVVVAAAAASSALDAVVDALRRIEAWRDKPIRSYAQVIKIFLVLFAGILAVGYLTDRSPWALLSGLGAMTAILLLVFKDSILGLVASIQIEANDMVRLGDWIEMSKYGADGEIIEMSLNTIKVQNWDKTITTIPTYALISDSFKNWRGMTDSGGRRIKRAVAIDVSSIHFLDDAEIDRLSRIELLAPYLEAKREELDAWNAGRADDSREPADLRRLTNVGTFRAYLESYLRSNEHVRRDMTFLVRQLPPGPTGLPIEIYVFSSEQRWAYYEAILADIFDHILAIVPEFGLRVFQNPAGGDLASFVAATDP